MKIHGKTRALVQPVPFTAYTKDGAELPVLLEPLPPGFQMGQEETLPWPSAPYRTARDGDGRIVRQKDRAPLSVPNEEDPQYVKRTAEVARARVAQMIVTSLANDPNFEIETERADMKDHDYWYAVYLEMDRDGLAPNEQTRIANKVGEISGLSMDTAQEEAMSTFRSAEEPGAAGGDEPS